MDTADHITVLLQNVESGKDGAMDQLMDAVYEQLQHVAEKHMRQRFGQGLAGVTMEPAALVNESFMKLIKQRSSYDNRGHFFAIATKVMLRVLTDYQRRRNAAKRGGDRDRVTLSLNDGEISTSDQAETIIEVDALIGAVERLEDLDSRKADVVKMRVVWGLEMREIAQSLGVSLATVERDWSFAKAWLAREAAQTTA